MIILENVEEFETWGPLTPDNKPCPKRRGMTFRRWKKGLEGMGYQVEMRVLRACDFGAPTIRKRLFIIARCDGRPIVWPEPTHCDPKEAKARGLKPWPTAADCIDWSLPCPSIFERKRPLAENTMRRIARGIQRYVIEASEPFVVTCNHSGDGFRGQGLRDPFLTLTANRDAHGLVVPYVTEHANASNQRNMAADEPLRTQCAQVKGGHFALVSAFLAKHFGGNETPGWPLSKPISTITARDHHALVSAFLLKYYGTDQDPQMRDPLHTVTTKERFGLVTVRGEQYRIVDIGMRMLAPRELYRAQGFPDSYRIDIEFNGKPLSKSAQVRMCGNSVVPMLAKALVEANCAELAQAVAA